MLFTIGIDEATFSVNAPPRGGVTHDHRDDHAMKDHDNLRALLNTSRFNGTHRRALAAGAGALALTGALSLTAALSGSASAAPAQASAKSATSTVPLSGWNLTLPVDSSGCQCGSATEISP